MKTNSCPSVVVLHSKRNAFGVIACLIFLITPPRALAQADSITISGAEFQRMTYSAHLLTQLAEKPELEASLQVLLEIQRRNPAVEPTALADLSREALQIYRSNAPAYVRSNGSRDEILTAYLDALRQVPGRTNVIPAHLSLLNSLVTRAQAPKDEREADLIHSGSQGLLGSEGDLIRRQALLDDCVSRAKANASFRTAVDCLLLPETPFSVSSSPAEIIGSTNSPLHENPTMQTLLALSVTNGGSLTVSSNLLMNLFTNETQMFWDTINTNLALHRELTRSQSDLLAYLTNQTAISADSKRLEAVQQGQARKIASATAAVLVQSKLMEARDPLIKLPDQMMGCVGGLHKITDGLAAFAEKDATRLAKTAATGNMLGGAMEIFNLFFGGESAEEQIAREVGNIKTLLGDLSTNMNYRFDRVDQSLTTIFDTLNERFDQVQITLDAQGRQIAHLNGDVDQIRLSLLDVQDDLFRIERTLATFHALDWRIELVEDMNYVRGFEARAGHALPYTDNAPYDFLSFETTFFTHAYNRAAWEPLSLYGTLPFGDQYIYSQLSPGGTTNAYAEVLNYIKKCLRQRLGRAEFSETPILSNPQDWSAGVNAWLQLAIENPNHFRRYERNLGYPSRLDGIISKGQELTNFFRSLVFTGPNKNVNWPLYDALEGFYVSKLTNFTGHIRSMEQQYATDHAIPSLEGWRAWALSVPLVTAASTALLTAGDGAAPVPTGLTNVVAVDGGTYHFLALQSDGTVIAWSRPHPPYEEFGQTNVPAGLSNVAAIAAGDYHNLALRSNGTVVAWGTGYWNYGQANVPTNLNNVVAITASAESSAALKSDGTVVCWGRGGLSPPSDVTNVIAISAGTYFNLALTADGRVHAWGDNYWKQCNVPADATNVVAISAGLTHSLALRADGTVVSWGRNDGGCTNVPADLSNVVAIAAGPYFSLALKADGTVRAWGYNDGGPCNVPLAATNVLAIGAVYRCSLYINSNPGETNAAALSLVRGIIPVRVRNHLWAVNDLVRTNLNFDLHDEAIELSGSKALFQSVLELAMPYTLERDDVLHGFLYGSEALADLEASRSFFDSENAKRLDGADAIPREFTEVASLRYLRFRERLDSRLSDIAATGQPEIPRVVGQTLRLLNLLRDSWAPAPQAAVEIYRETNACDVVLYGEPYTHYALQHCNDLNLPAWWSCTATNIHNGENVALPITGAAQRFYRAVLPVMP